MERCGVGNRHASEYRRLDKLAIRAERHHLARVVVVHQEPLHKLALAHRAIAQQDNLHISGVDIRLLFLAYVSIVWEPHTAAVDHTTTPQPWPRS